MQLRLNARTQGSRRSPGTTVRGRALLGIRPYSLADYWLTSVWVGLRSLPGGYWRQAMARILNPLSYPRMTEFALMHELLGPLRGRRVLDIGSPKLPVLLLARDPDMELHATDLRDYFVEPTAHFLHRAGLGDRLGTGIHLAVADARAMGYATGEFDLAYSVSVLEHIPGTGDSEAIREIGRVLKPGGAVCLTVPFDVSGYREEWVRGDVYERKFRKEEVFYQRHYDMDGLNDRLVAPSGLRLERIEYFGEPGFQFERYWNGVPMKWKVPLLWAQPFLARFLFKRLPPERIDRATGVALLLRKGG